jgi:predicted metal-binding membrane protein
MTGIGYRAARRSVALPWLLVGLVATAWLALWQWGASPYAHQLGHHGGAAGADGWPALALFLAGWTLMIVAMMLPTATALLRAYCALVRHRPGRTGLVALVVVGFLAAWLATGGVFRLAGLAVHALVAGVGWLRGNPTLLGAAALALAGGYQFTPLKYRCLTACRSPRSFIYRHWRGGPAATDALRIGLAYGWSCVGCCWALMFVMFVLGLASLPWMLGLAVLMTVEKNTAAGWRLRVPLGVALVAAALALAAAPAPVDEHAGHRHSHALIDRGLTA